ncbi:hypothetical protein Mal52_22540 [Symmachiella dynata]|uniref:Uncharacterized protein n=1 Tax=Symmachiella dynata TaxID=2527995 RepID=A0A517ZMS7_9PLAN|nr:hypothetical protein [Symmachiella dynata]QDU43778.1 hypothetical protein Mal52_22540 [Symmachiella dynata]
MTTDKPKWWQSWMVYALIGLLLTLGPYVGGYFLLGEHEFFSRELGWHFRDFESVVSRKLFGPMGYVEAQIRGETVIVWGPGGSGLGDLDIYEPGW